MNSSAYSEFRAAFLKDGCPACPLLPTRKNLVFDRGNPAARILVVGEAPGAEEEKAGFCFVGRAGKMLDKILLSVGLDPARDVLITNTVKCRPPDNRVPLQSEIDACRPHLMRQIDILRPAVMVLLGATAFKHVVTPKKGFSISEAVGNVYVLKDVSARSADFPDPNLKLMPLFHPAYLLYDPRKKAVMFEHVKRLRRFLIDEGALSADTPEPAGETPPF